MGCALVLMVGSAHANVLTWNTGSGSWNTPGNWTPNGTPGASDTADFTGQNLTAAAAISLSGNGTAGIINLGDSDSTHAYTLSNDGAITLNNGTSNAQINEAVNTAGDTVLSNLNLAGNGNLDITNNSTKALSFGAGVTVGTITGATGAVSTVTVKNASSGVTNLYGISDGASGGSISLVLDAGASTINMKSGNYSTFTGAVEIKSGLVSMGSTAGLGRNDDTTGSRVTIDSGARLQLKAGTMQRNLTVSGTGTGNGAIIFTTASGSANFSALNDVELVGNAGFGPAATASLTINGEIKGAGALMLMDTGTLTLVHSNSYAGGTQVQKGTLNVNSGSSLGTGDVSVSTGATLNLLGLNSIADTANLSFSLDSVINLTFTGTETIGALNLGANYIGIGTYDATALNNYFALSPNVFSGSGLLAVSAVPEPGTCVLFVVGLLAVLGYRLRNRTA